MTKNIKTRVAIAGVSLLSVAALAIAPMTFAAPQAKFTCPDGTLEISIAVADEINDVTAVLSNPSLGLGTCPVKSIIIETESASRSLGAINDRYEIELTGFVDYYGSDVEKVTIIAPELTANDVNTIGSILKKAAFKSGGNLENADAKGVTLEIAGTIDLSGLDDGDLQASGLAGLNVTAGSIIVPENVDLGDFLAGLALTDGQLIVQGTTPYEYVNGDFQKVTAPTAVDVVPNSGVL
jgi:hypothetical protein